MTEFGKLFT